MQIPIVLFLCIESLLLTSCGLIPPEKPALTVEPYAVFSSNTEYIGVAKDKIVCIDGVSGELLLADTAGNVVSTQIVPSEVTIMGEIICAEEEEEQFYYFDADGNRLDISEFARPDMLTDLDGRLTYFINIVGVHFMGELEVRLNRLWGSVIRDYTFDISKSQICMTLEKTDNNILSTHNISISGIDMFYFADSLYSGKSNIPIFLELTSIGVIESQDSKHAVVSLEIGEEEDSRVPNIMIEISDTCFVISAEHIVIDGVDFKRRKDGSFDHVGVVQSHWEDVGTVYPSDQPG